jgi:Fe-S oxidoreductase
MVLERMTVESDVIIDDERWHELVELTGGAAAICYQCGVCTAICPWGEVREETVSIRAMMRQAQLGLLDTSESLWLCATCAQCEAYCPRGVHIADVIRGLRYLVWQQRQTPEGLPSLLWSIHWNNNPWTQPPSLRSAWASDLHIPFYDPEQHELLLYVGCTASYDRRAQQVARSLVRLFDAAGVSFGFLGDEEPCCGEAALNVGHKPYFQEIADETARRFRDKGVKHLVTVSPHCYDVFKNHYPALRKQNRPIPHHYTQTLAHLLREERLQLKTPVARRVTFHDPCYLTRHNDESAAPRQILEAIPGLELVEMAHAGVDALCCGGGGGRMWLETEPGQRFADIRIQEALATGAEVIATACPFCIACLEDSIKAGGIQGLVVMDVAEIAALALNG